MRGPNKNSLPHKSPSPKRIRRSPRFDRVNPSRFIKQDFIYYCEQCSHFDALNKFCSIGYNPPKHMYEDQQKAYNLMGKIAYCRFLEID